MAQGDTAGERVCEDCGRTWYSTALLTGQAAECPECGGALVSDTDD